MNGLAASERRDLILSVGTHQVVRRLSPLEVARLLRKTIEHGTSRRACSSALGVGTTQIGTFLKLLTLAPEVQHLAGWGSASVASVSFSSLAELSRLPTADQVEASEAILRNRLTWKEVVEVVQIADRSGKDVGECVTEVTRRRPRVENLHVFMGKVDRHIETDLSGLSQIERDSYLSIALDTLVGADKSIEGRLGSGIFTVVTAKDLLSLLDMSPDQFEIAVNSQLRKVQLSSGRSA